jgi:hypothetical protein
MPSIVTLSESTEEGRTDICRVNSCQSLKETGTTCSYISARLRLSDLNRQLREASVVALSSCFQLVRMDVETRLFVAIESPRNRQYIWN